MVPTVYCVLDHNENSERAREDKKEKKKQYKKSTTKTRIKIYILNGEGLNEKFLLYKMWSSEQKMMLATAKTVWRSREQGMCAV